MNAGPKLPPLEWFRRGRVPLPGGTYAIAYQLDSLCVLSAVEWAESADGSDVIVPHWHVSVATIEPGGGRRVSTDEEVERVRAAFDMGGADEDNHGPGIVRHLWLQVGKRVEEVCPCKQDEDRIVEGDRVRFEEVEAR